MTRDPQTIGRVAALTGLTVRALHHYDEIGLISPSCRSAAGYRLYSEDDLQRLQQVLLFRELGFALDAVRDLLDASADARREALLSQRDALEAKRRHAEAVLKAVDATLHTLQGHPSVNTEKLFEGCDQFRNGEYAAEAEQRWGKTDAWKVSRERTGKYSREDWAAIQSESDAITAEFAAAFTAGDAADGERALALAEAHRMHIHTRFYPCSHAMHVQVASMYTNDPRFQAYYDRHGAGLAAYIETAIQANAAQHGR